VHYAALDLPGLRGSEPAAFAAARRSVLICSGLWGLLRPSDRVPAYRLGMAARLPGVGTLASFWRPWLTDALREHADRQLLLDLRSTPYAAAWRPPADRTGQVVSARVLHERIVGGVPKRVVVSHFNKATKGRLTRALLGALGTGARIRDAKGLAELLADLGFVTELTAPTGSGQTWQLDVVVNEL
jgi:cytoplasmic iron level regulating protein YaaA (DUF328/UPF0246 family)